MRQPQQRRQERGGGTPLAYVTIALVIIAFAGTLAAGIWQQRNHVATDRDTLCPKSGPKALTVILVDATDAMSDIQKASVKARLEKTITDLQEYEAVEVKSIEAGADLLKPGFRVCRPVSPDQTSDWTGNKTLARRQFDEVFKPRIATVLAKAAAKQESEASPIMEAVQQVAVGTFHPADVAAGGFIPKRLVIVSDMLENGKGGSHYRGVPDFERFRSSPEFRSLSAELEGVDVYILYLSRQQHAAVQGEPHAQFWRRYFWEQHAQVRNIYWIEGG